MRKNIKLYFGAFSSVIVPTALQGCNGVCGSCGAGCAVTALVVCTAGFCHWRKRQINLVCKEGTHEKQE